ncbi:hypothetical protein Tco_1169525 [Tanacetum coccineum]
MTTSNSSVNVSQPQIPVFKRDSYEFWSIKMKTLFRSQDLWDLVGKGCADSTSEETTNKENHKRDAKALFFIQQAVDETIFSRTVAANSAKEAWDTLKIEYQSCSFSEEILNLQSLKAMKLYKHILPESQALLAKILRSLSCKLDHVVAAIQESKDLSTYSVDELMGSLQTHKARIRNVVKKEHAFQVQGKQANLHINVSSGRVMVLENEDVADERNISCNIAKIFESSIEPVSIHRTFFVNKEMVKGLPIIKEREHTCEGCALGKQARKSFPVAQAKRAEEKLE